MGWSQGKEHHAAQLTPRICVTPPQPRTGKGVACKPHFPSLALSSPEAFPSSLWRGDYFGQELYPLQAGSGVPGLCQNPASQVLWG